MNKTEKQQTVLLALSNVIDAQDQKIRDYEEFAKRMIDAFSMATERDVPVSTLRKDLRCLAAAAADLLAANFAYKMTTGPYESKENIQ